MNFIRDYIDSWYNRNRDKIFAATKEDPEVAHEKFVRLAKLIHGPRLEKLILDCRENQNSPDFKISNAAGFNKNGNIPPTFLRYLGFDRVVVGTVTGDSWKGNSRPRIKRYSETDSMVNWMGLPGVGVEEVVRNLESYGNHRIPITINLMATPEKEGEELLRDLEKTVLLTKDLPSLIRYELNISCPNTHGTSGGIDARREYEDQLDGMLYIIGKTFHSFQEIWLKVSPDQDIEGVRDTIQISKKHRRVIGFTISNTTTVHSPKYITSSPNSGRKGGASGDAVYEISRDVQDRFYREITGQGLNYKIIACGGINSAKRALERTMDGNEKIEDIQIFTPLIFEGPKLLRELRTSTIPP